jgi:hypothetical protein
VNKVRHGAVWQFLTEGFYVSQARDPATRFLMTALQPSNWLFPAWKAADLVNLVTGGRVVAPFLEGATREGASVSTKMAGGTDEQAQRAYWRVTGTFNEHAGMADFRVLMSMPGFFNPMIQAVRGAAQNLTDPDPKVSGSAWAKLLLLIPGMFAGAAIGRFLLMNDDDKKRERERPVEDRLSYHDVGGFRIRFPYGPEGAMGSFVYNAVMDDLLDRKPGEAKLQSRLLLNRIAGMGTPLEFMGPQLKTVTEAQMNWSNFRQRHIVSPWMTALPAAEQYSAGTPEFYRKLGAWADYSPAKLQFIVQNGISRQVDETINFLYRIERDKPIEERADIPFVGRMFIRDPLAFSSASVQELQKIDERIRLLDARMNAAGFGWLRQATEVDARPEVRALQVQLAHLGNMRDGVKVLQRMSQVAKFYELAGDWDEQRNMRSMMTNYAQSLLAENPDEAKRIETALELLETAPSMSPIQKAVDYGGRAF